eukprot:gene33927-60078_t
MGRHLPPHACGTNYGPPCCTVRQRDAQIAELNEQRDMLKQSAGKMSLPKVESVWVPTATPTSPAPVPSPSAAGCSLWEDAGAPPPPAPPLSTALTKLDDDAQPPPARNPSDNNSEQRMPTQPAAGQCWESV